MDRKLKREFVYVQGGVGCTGFIRIIKQIEGMYGCSVTQHDDTITCVCSTINGLASLMSLCTLRGEGPAESMLDDISRELVEFIG